MVVKMYTKKNWGGPWTNDKLDTFQKYVMEYLKIMHSQRRKYQTWPKEIIYFDGFAGGDKYGETKEEETILQEFLPYMTKEEANVYKSSPERVLDLDLNFDTYYFIDKNKQNIENLKNQLSQKYPQKINLCQFIPDDANTQLCRLICYLEKDPSKAALILLDPFGMQIKWSSIENLKNCKRIDLWILIPSGVAINRLLDRSGNLKQIKTLKEFYGLDEEEIRNFFYNEKIEKTLLGEEKNKYEKSQNTIKKATELYIIQLKKVFKHVTEEPLELINSRNVPIYHFVFASHNSTALKIASYIINKKRSKQK